MWGLLNPIQNFLQSYILSHFIRSISLLEAMIVSDGIYTAFKFTKEYIYYKIRRAIASNESNLSKDDKRLLLQDYNKLYRLSIMDRYILYCLLYILSFGLWPICNYLFVSFLILTIPYIQNYILELNIFNKWITCYLENKQIFIRYSCSKGLINWIKDLHKRIDSIKNYHIFVLYKYLSFQMVIDFIRSFLFIHLLYFLRNNEKTYYYYKAIKLSYYYSTGYLFNLISVEDSAYIINIIITEKKWYDLSKLEVVHAFYTLIDSKYNKGDNIYINFSLHLAKFCTLWSFICLLKILTIKMNTILLVLSFFIDYRLNYRKDFKEKFVERSGIIILVYGLLLLNTNDLIISAIFVLYKFIYLVYCELLFFITNIKDIKKVLDFYQKQGCKTLKMKTERLKLSERKNTIDNNENLDTEYVVVSK